MQDLIRRQPGVISTRVGYTGGNAETETRVPGCDGAAALSRFLHARRHVADWFEASAEERIDLMALADEARALLIKEGRPDGLQPGVNVGKAAGRRSSMSTFI
jgi:hypothetical protein